MCVHMHVYILVMRDTTDFLSDLNLKQVVSKLSLRYI